MGLISGLKKMAPQLFDNVDGVPSARFFPKGVVHSIKPYGKVENELLLEGSQHSEPQNGAQSDEYGNSRIMRGGSAIEGDVESKNSMKASNGRFRKNRNRRSSGSGLESSSNWDGFNSEQKVETPSMQGVGRRFRRAGHSPKLKDTDSGVYDMSLQRDGSYGFQVGNQQGDTHYGDKDGSKLK